MKRYSIYLREGFLDLEERNLYVQLIDFSQNFEEVFFFYFQKYVICILGYPEKIILRILQQKSKYPNVDSLKTIKKPDFSC